MAILPIDGIFIIGNPAAPYLIAVGAIPKPAAPKPTTGSTATAAAGAKPNAAAKFSAAAGIATFVATGDEINDGKKFCKHKTI